MRKPIHLVCDTDSRDIVKSILKHHKEKVTVQVVKLNGKQSWSADDTLIVWHGADTGSTLLFCYLCKIIPGVLYEIDYTHADNYAESGYSIVAIGEQAIIKAGCVGAHTIVPEDVKKNAATTWDRLTRDSKPNSPLMLMGEDGIIRTYPDDYLDEWLIGHIKWYLSDKERISIAYVVGRALGVMIVANDNVLGTDFFEKRLFCLAAEHRIKIEDGFILRDDSFDTFDTSWLYDFPNEWANYRRWKSKIDNNSL